jgi:multiple sugar transport system substrate-binding protein
VPANGNVRTAVTPALDPNDKAVADFMGAISGEVVPSQLAPAGAATFTQSFQRYTGEVLFGRMTPDQAAKALISEVNSAL